MNNISININMNNNQGKYLCNGRSQEECSDNNMKIVHKYRHQIITRGRFHPDVVTYPNLSDEFINDYIPNDLSEIVRWQDILVCGMIPEQRVNSHIRSDIQFNNISDQYHGLEAPSPAPVPDPGTPPTLSLNQSSIIVEASEVKNNMISCSKTDDAITIIFMDNENNEKYINIIQKSDKLWEDIYSKYFQEDFQKFFTVLNKTFTEKNFYVKWTIKEKNQTDIVIQVYCEDDLFGFNVDITLKMDMGQVDKLEKRIKELEEKEKKHDDLEKKLEKLQVILMSLSAFANTIGPETNYVRRMDTTATGDEDGAEPFWSRFKSRENWEF